MNYETEQFKVTSDKYQFTLYAKKVIEAGANVKPENVGKVVDVFVGHYPKFDQLMRGAIRYGLSGDEINSLEAMSNKIDSICDQFAVVLK